MGHRLYRRLCTDSSSSCMSCLLRRLASSALHSPESGVSLAGRMWLLLSPFASVSLAALVSASFVLSLYVWRHPLTVDRDQPKVIRQRIASTLSIAILTAPFLWSIRWTPPTPHLPEGVAASPFAPGPPLAEWMGFPVRPASEYLLALLLPTLLTASLFLGPIVVSVLLSFRVDAADEMRVSFPALAASFTSFLGDLCSPSERWKSIRNLVAAPIAEEVVFRGAVLALLVAGGFGFGTCVLLSPLLFGLAHLHHLVNLVKALGLSLANGALVVTFQLAYTTLFGAYAAFVYLRTGHMASAIVAHTCCNLMGFPELAFMSNRHYLYPKRFAILAVFGAGVVIFSLSLYPLTDPSWFTTAAGEGPWLSEYQRMLQPGGGMAQYKMI